MELGVAQTHSCDAIQCRRRDYAAERPGYAITLVIGHDEKDVRRALRGHDLGGQIRFGLRSLKVDLATEFGGWWGKVFPVDGRRCVWCAGNAAGLLCRCGT